MSDDTYPMPPHGWTCFHCGETFTTVGSARDHFGIEIDAFPGCIIRHMHPGTVAPVPLGEEKGLLMELRIAQKELARYRVEDSDTDRKFYAMQADHQTALRKAEEEGYAKGLRDGMKEAIDAPNY